MNEETVSGELTYFEIGVADAEKAHTFYGSLFGWQLEPAPSGNGYGISTQTIPGGMNGSGLGTSPQMYFRVPDIEAAMQRVRELGGQADTLESLAEVPEEETITPLGASQSAATIKAFSSDFSSRRAVVRTGDLQPR